MIVPKILCTVDLNNQGLCEPTGKLFKEGLGNIEFQRLKMKGLQFSEFKPNLQRFKHIYICIPTYTCRYAYEGQVVDV